MKRIAILGSTGSIGISALSVIRHKSDNFEVSGLSTSSNVGILRKQIREFKPLSVCVREKKPAAILKKSLKPEIKIFSGDDGLLDMIADLRIDRFVLAISGSAALLPLLKIIDSRIDVALANKEALVMAGPIIMERARRKKVKLIPIDSEQSAIWQCLEGRDHSKIRCIYLTASGGPFRKFAKAKLCDISVKQALKHPRWKMGKKITIDSASLMNKGLELLEVMYLFGVGPDKIKILVHPESIIHSMVEFIDGSILAQLSITDMRIPIQYALAYPERLQNSLKGVDFYKLNQLNFERPDFAKFPCLGLSYKAAFDGGTMPCVLNAANEAGVEGFLNKKMDFISIAKVIERVMKRHIKITNPDLKDILAADRWARREAENIIESRDIR